ncbi:MAG TPA: NAD(P)-dependent oxidoreductase [bacterium]|nr:NAD(P)-dependent oxidoreductase [bacterium]
MPEAFGSENAVVCVTGASGFTGSTAVDCLLLNGYSVLATDHPDRDFSAVKQHKKYMSEHPNRYNGVSLHIAPADLDDEKELASIFKAHRVMYLLHPASLFNLSATRELLWKVNIEGTRNLLRAAADNAKELLGTAIWSTGMVYGAPRRPGPLKETDKPNPSNLYTQSKLEQEYLALEFEKNGMPLVILRPANTYGPRSAYGAAKAIRPLSWGSFFPLTPIPGSGERLAHYVHIDDVVAAAVHLTYIMGHKQVSGEIFNIADDAPVTIGDLLARTAGLLKVKPPVFKIPEQTLRMVQKILPRETQVPFFGIEQEEISDFLYQKTFDNSKLKSTGYRLKYPDIRDGLEPTLDWYVRNGKLEKIWYLTNPKWRDYGKHIRPEQRPFADYTII